MKQEKVEVAQLTTNSKDKGKGIKGKYDEKAAKVKGPSHKKPQKDLGPDDCFFCENPGHKRWDCPNYHAWRVKKGLSELPKTK